MDEFFAYAATLREPEQRALGPLHVRARDSHTGEPFDYAITRAVKDAKANLTGFYKVRTSSAFSVCVSDEWRGHRDMSLKSRGWPVAHWIFLV